MVFLLILALSSLCIASADVDARSSVIDSDTVVITAITESFNNRSTFVMDRVLVNFIYQKSHFQL